MVRESLLSNTSPPCDERTLCEHVKHHTPEHLSVRDARPRLERDEQRKGQNHGRGCGAVKEHKSSSVLKVEKVPSCSKLWLNYYLVNLLKHRFN